MDQTLKQLGLTNILANFAEAEVFANSAQDKPKQKTTKTQSDKDRKAAVDRIAENLAGTPKRSKSR